MSTRPPTSSARLFSLPSYRFSVPDLDGAIGKWSRAGTYGDKSAKGEGLVFDVAALSRFIENAEARGDEIAIDQDHKTAYIETTGSPAPSLGFFHAMALFQNGTLVKHWARDGAPAPDGTGYDGKPRDGLYFRLGRITPLGYDSTQGLANYSGLSLMFSEDGQAEDGSPIGHSLICVAATSSPFLAGTPIEFSRLSAPAAQAVTMAKVGDVVVDSSSNRRGKVIRKDGMDWTIQWANGSTVTVGPGVLDVGMGTESDPHVFSAPTNGATAMAGKSWDPNGRRWLEWSGNYAVERTSQGEYRLGDDFFPSFDAAIAAAIHRGYAKPTTPPPGAMSATTPTTSPSVATRRFNKGAAMDEMQMAAKYGFLPEDDDKAKLAKVMAYGDGPPVEAPATMAAAPDEEKKEADADEAQAMTALSQSLASRGIVVPVNASRAVLMSLASVAPAQPDVAALVAKEIARIREQEAQQARDAEAAQLVTMARTAKAPEHEITALSIVAKADIATARTMAAKYSNGTSAPLHLFNRLSAAGGPLSDPGDGSSARTFAGPKAPTVRKVGGMEISAPDEQEAAAIRTLAFSAVPADVAKVDALIPTASERGIPYIRLMAAGRVIDASKSQ
jgi:hypothetical protein